MAIQAEFCAYPTWKYVLLARDLSTLMSSVASMGKKVLEHRKQFGQKHPELMFAEDACDLFVVHSGTIISLDRRS